jgi:5-formyltetrahydrofolate cyclo-ligase
MHPTFPDDIYISKRCNTVFTALGHNGGMTPVSHVDVRALSPEEAKTAWRAAVRKHRSERSDRRLAEHALALRDHLVALPEVTGAHCASVYASRRFEPGTMPLIEELDARGIRVLVPLLGDGLQRGWANFVAADDVVERAPGRPPEPSGEFLPQDALSQADVVIVPALAADTSGTRLGQGGGWYDRALLDARPGVPIIALVFDDEFHIAETKAIPREAHDLPVSIVVTPSGVHRIGA